MRKVEQLTPDLYPRKFTAEQKQELAEYLTREIEDAKGARTVWDRVQAESLRLYEAVPKLPKRNLPVKNSPNLVIPLAGTTTDAVYSSVLDLLFSIQPPLTCRPTQARYERHARALQRWVDHSVDARYKLRPAAESAIHDACRGGTGFYYVPWVNRVVKHRSYTVEEASPVIRAVPAEDIFEPAGSGDDLQGFEWVALRENLTRSQLEDRETLAGWKIAPAEPSGGRGQAGVVKRARDLTAHTRSIGRRTQDEFEVFHIWLVYDIDGDGKGEDLYVVFDYTSRSVLKVRFNPYQYKPLTYMNFQKRAHMLRGVGCPELLGQIQDAATEILCYGLANMMLANTRIWTGPAGLMREKEELYPGKFIPSSNPDALKSLQMADLYPSAFASLQAILSLAERRVGMDVAGPRQSVAGSRTPGITALTMAQQHNRRFAGAFDSIRAGTSGAVWQALMRDSEQLRAHNPILVEELRRVLGEEDAELVGEVLASPHFEEQVIVEITAGSVSLNREADKQNAVMLLNQMMSYYERALQLLQVQAQMPPGELREKTGEVLEKANLFLVKMLATFDQIRSPESYVIQGGLDAGAGGVPGGAQGGSDPLAAILGLLGGAPGGTVGGVGAGAGAGAVEATPGSVGGA